mgnify:CR=1 FL=1
MDDQAQRHEGSHVEWEELRVAGTDILEKVKELIHQGNIRRIVIRQGDKTIMELSLTWAAVGTLLAPVLAAVARYAPLAVAMVAAQWRRVDPALLDVARVTQARPWQAGLQVALPLLAPGCLAGMGVVFVLSLGELGATLLVVPPGRSTLTLRIYNYLHYGATGDVAGLCLVILAIALFVGLGTVAVLAVWGRLLPDRGGATP